LRGWKRIWGVTVEISSINDEVFMSVTREGRKGEEVLTGRFEDVIDDFIAMISLYIQAAKEGE